MSTLPVSGAMYFKDFAFDLVSYQIVRCDEVISTLQGIPNVEDGIPYVHFPYGSDIRMGDVLVSGSSRSVVTETRIDTYCGKPELLAALIR